MINEAEFPEWRRFQCGDYTDSTVTISRLEVDAWFKRCMADFPDLAVVEFYKWFEKWFSQFIEKGDKNGV